MKVTIELDTNDTHFMGNRERAIEMLRAMVRETSSEGLPTYRREEVHV